MEDWKMWAFWTALGFNLVAGVWSLVAAIRYMRKVARLDRETYGVPARADEEATRKEIAEWLAGAYKKMYERDQAALAELRSQAPLEDARMPGPRLPPPPNPRPNPPDSGLNDEQWMQFLARQRAETVQIDPIPKTYKECFFNRGVFMALESVFRSPKPLYSRDSREYAEMVWAFWELAPHFGTFWPDDGVESSEG